MEPRADMLPDASLTSGPVVDDGGQPIVETPIAPVTTNEPVQQASPVGSKTPEPNLYAALQEERRRRREAEEKLESFVNVPSELDMSDEGKVLRKEIQVLKDKVELGELVQKYPALKEKQSEFDEFRADYPRHRLENVAKLFLVENGMMETAPNRIGLERPTSGPKTNTDKKYTGEEISAMMKNDNRRFQKMVQQGIIKPEDIDSVA